MAGNVEANKYYSPTFIKAKTPEDLETQMLSLNLTEGRVYDFNNIQFVNGNWYAWFNVDQSKRVKKIKKDKRRD